jgi:hypothetical protein
LIACAHEQPKAQPVDVSRLPPLPASSIAAVIEHRQELVLTDDQVRRLQELDNQRVRADQEITEKSEQHKEAAPQRPANAGMGGRGMGMGRRGMGMRGGGYSRGASGGNDRQPRTLQDRLDDNDTNAYLTAEEEILMPSQRPRAREIAEDFREQQYERRDQLRRANSQH